MFSRFLRLFRRQRCPFCEGHLIEQAKEQLSVGESVAAIASARCYVAQRLHVACRELGLLKKVTTKHRLKFQWMASRLRDIGVIDTKQFADFQRFNQQFTAIMDGGPKCNTPRARRLVIDAIRLSDLLDRQLASVGEPTS